MALVNTTLLRPRNAAVIVAIAALTHVLARPLYRAVAQKKGS